MSPSHGPTFLIAGAARSGTTAIAEALRRHPEVFVTEPKEPHFLALGDRPLRFRGPGDAETINRLAVTDADSYRQLFRDAGDAVARGEGSVSTMYYADRAVERIQRHAPDARIVVVLREPADRAFSAFQYLRARGFEPEDDFEVSLDDEARRIADDWHHLWHYVAMGAYGAQLVTLVDGLGPGRLAVAFFDDHVLDRAGFLARIHQAIGVAPRPSDADDDRVNASGVPRSALVQALVRLPTRHPRLRAVGRRVVPYRAWHRLRAANLEPASVPPEARERIRAELAADRLVLRRVLGDPRVTVLGDPPAWTA